MKKQNYILLTLIALVLLVALAFMMGYRPSGALSANEAGEKALSFINEALLGEGVQATLISVTPEHNLFKIKIDIQGSAHDSYISQDGELFFIEGINIKEHLEITLKEAEKSKPPVNLTEFISCLAEAKVMIYGANWCSHTNSFVNLLGGYELVDSIYIECTKEEEACQEKNITGYPTVLISDNNYQGGRNFHDLAEATGCKLIY